jgi:hypothetical protein
MDSSALPSTRYDPEKTTRRCILLFRCNSNPDITDRVIFLYRSSIGSCSVAVFVVVLKPHILFSLLGVSIDLAVLGLFSSYHHTLFWNLNISSRLLFLPTQNTPKYAASSFLSHCDRRKWRRCFVIAPVHFE